MTTYIPSFGQLIAADEELMLKGTVRPVDADELEPGLEALVWDVRTQLELWFNSCKGYAGWMETKAQEIQSEIILDAQNNATRTVESLHSAIVNDIGVYDLSNRSLDLDASVRKNVLLLNRGIIRLNILCILQSLKSIANEHAFAPNIVIRETKDNLLSISVTDPENVMHAHDHQRLQEQVANDILQTANLIKADEASAMTVQVHSSPHRGTSIRWSLPQGDTIANIPTIVPKLETNLVEPDGNITATDLHNYNESVCLGDDRVFFYSAREDTRSTRAIEGLMKPISTESYAEFIQNPHANVAVAGLKTPDAFELNGLVAYVVHTPNAKDQQFAQETIQGVLTGFEPAKRTDQNARELDRILHWQDQHMLYVDLLVGSTSKVVAPLMRKMFQATSQSHPNIECMSAYTIDSITLHEVTESGGDITNHKGNLKSYAFLRTMGFVSVGKQASKQTMLVEINDWVREKFPHLCRAKHNGEKISITITKYCDVLVANFSPQKMLTSRNA